MLQRAQTGGLRQVLGDVAIAAHDEAKAPQPRQQPIQSTPDTQFSHERSPTLPRGVDHLEIPIGTVMSRLAAARLRLSDLRGDKIDDNVEERRPNESFNQR
jgi:hypothetical protein